MLTSLKNYFSVLCSRSGINYSCVPRDWKVGFASKKYPSLAQIGKKKKHSGHNQTISPQKRNTVCYIHTYAKALRYAVQKQAQVWSYTESLHSNGMHLSRSLNTESTRTQAPITTE